MNWLAAGFMGLALGWTPASAQETRADEIRQQRAAKAGQLETYTPNKVEAVLFQIEDQRWPEKIFNPPRGLFARIGGLPEGAGFAGGPGYRWSNHTVSFTTTAVASMLGYWDVDGTIAFPRLADAHAFALVAARRRNLPQEDFFGLGGESRQSDRTSYALRATSFEAAAGVTPTSWLTVAGAVEQIMPRLGRGRDPTVPSTGDLFADASAPGLERQPDFVRVGARTTVDYIDRPFGSGLGGRYTVSFDKYSDRDFGQYSFNRWNVELQQFIPLVHSARVLALRGYVATLTPNEGQTVPFYLQPTLGGGYSLRGLRAYRLRDRNVLLLQAEYRWEVNPFLTGVLFYDAGKVAARRRDLDLNDLTDDYGLGVRFGFAGQAAIRVELAFGSGEGTRLVFKFNNVF